MVRCHPSCVSSAHTACLSASLYVFILLSSVLCVLSSVAAQVRRLQQAGTSLRLVRMILLLTTCAIAVSPATAVPAEGTFGIRAHCRTPRLLAAEACAQPSFHACTKASCYAMVQRRLSTYILRLLGKRRLGLRCCRGPPTAASFVRAAVGEARPEKSRHPKTTAFGSQSAQARSTDATAPAAKPG